MKVSWISFTIVNRLCDFYLSLVINTAIIIDETVKSVEVPILL